MKQHEMSLKRCIIIITGSAGDPQHLSFFQSYLVERLCCLLKFGCLCVHADSCLFLMCCYLNPLILFHRPTIFVHFQAYFQIPVCLCGISREEGGRLLQKQLQQAVAALTRLLRLTVRQAGARQLQLKADL